MKNKEAGVLIIKNIAMLEEAYDLMNGELSETVYIALGELIHDWANERDWSGSFDSYESDTWFAPAQWKSQEDGKESWIAKYWWGDQNPDENWPLSTLLAAKTGRDGFRFYLEWKSLQNPNKRIWKAFANRMNSEYKELEITGFQFEPEEGTWFLPWKLDAEQLAKDYVDESFANAFTPLKQALGQLSSAHNIFVKVVDLALQEFATTREQ